jgi:RecB family exonuclease
MPLTLITGPANCGKARAVLEEMRLHAARGSEPLLVVPTHADVQRYRRELADAGRVMGVRVERFRGLLDEIVRRAQSNGRPLARALTPLLREQLLRVLTARDGIGDSATQDGQESRREGMPAARPGHLRALAQFVSELHTERVTPQRLHEALATWAAAEEADSEGEAVVREVSVAEDVAAGRAVAEGVAVRRGTRGANAKRLSVLFEGYRELLAQLERTDPEQRATLALDRLRREPSLWGSTPVLLYGFDDLTRLQLDAVETLGRVVDAPVSVSLAYEASRVAFAGRAGAFQTLLPWAAEHRSLPARADYYAPHARAVLHGLERGLFEPERALLEVSCEQGRAHEVVRLLEGGSPRAELELVAQRIRTLLDEGMAPADIAIVHRAPGAIAELLAEVLRSFAIPFHLTQRLPLHHTALGRALCGLLAAACAGEAADEPGTSSTGLADLLAWLRAPGLIERTELVDRFEAKARRTGLRSVAQARSLWEAEHWPLKELDELRAAAARGPAALIEQALHELRRLFCAPRRATAQVLDDAAGLEEAAALACGMRALEELAELARQAPALAPDVAGLLEILRALQLDVGLGGRDVEWGRRGGELGGRDVERGRRGGELGRRDVERGRRGGEQGERDVEGERNADAVVVLDPLALRARRVRALFLCGLQAGVFPAVPPPEPVLSEEERRSLAEVAGLRLSAPRQALAAERYLLYAAISRPEELLVLSWHTAEEDGRPAIPSLFIDDICDLLPAELREGRIRRPAGAAFWSGEATPVREPPASQESLASRDSLSSRDSLAPQEPLAPQESLAPQEPPTLQPLRDERLLAELRAQRLWSASALETFQGCPARWLVERLLRARALDPDPEPLARGGLAHAALRDTFAGLRERFGSAQLLPAHLPAARELLREALARHAVHFPLSVSPERVPGVRRRLEADLERYLVYAAEQNVKGQQDAIVEQDVAERHAAGRDAAEHGAAERRAATFTPTYLELSFGFPEEQPPLPPLDLGEGVLVRGRIDRIDVAEGGEAIVYDYKGTQATPADRWLADGSLQMAIYMRAAEQLLHADVIGGFYQPLAGRDLRARGVLSDAGDPRLALSNDVREHAQLRELVDGVLELARTAAREADAGVLQARPDTCAFGDGGCLYPSICRCER